MEFNQNTEERLQYFYEDGLKDCSWIPDTFEEFLQFVECFNVIIPKNNEYIMLVSINIKFVYLDTIYVPQNLRGNGIATKVLEETLNEFNKVILFCNKNLVDFYAKFGFAQDNDLDYAILMKENK